MQESKSLKDQLAELDSHIYRFRTTGIRLTRGLAASGYACHPCLPPARDQDTQSLLPRLFVRNCVVKGPLPRRVQHQKFGNHPPCRSDVHTLVTQKDLKEWPKDEGAVTTTLQHLTQVVRAQVLIFRFCMISHWYREGLPQLDSTAPSRALSQHKAREKERKKGLQVLFLGSCEQTHLPLPQSIFVISEANDTKSFSGART